MRVAFISLHVGGMLHYVSNLANSIADEDVACFCPQESDPELFDPRIALYRYSIPQRLAPSELPYALRLPLTLRKMVNDIEEWAPDVLHVNSGHITYFAFLRRLTRQFAAVATLHDVTPHYGEPRPFDGIKLAPVLKHCRVILVHTRGLRTQAIARWSLNEDRVRVFPFSAFSTLTRWAGKAVERPGTILLFGRLRAYKGIDIMLGAMPTITKAVPGARLVIAGQGDLSPYNYLIEAAGDSVTIHNRFVSEEETARLFEEASLVAVPYVEASQSALPFVAAAFRTPVVASRVGGIPEVVEHGQSGVLIDPHSEQQLASACIELLTDPEKRSRMGDYAKTRIEAECGPAVIARELRDLYEDVTT